MESNWRINAALHGWFVNGVELMAPVSIPFSGFNWVGKARDAGGPFGFLAGLGIGDALTAYSTALPSYPPNFPYGLVPTQDD